MMGFNYNDGALDLGVGLRFEFTSPSHTHMHYVTVDI